MINSYERKMKYDALLHFLGDFNARQKLGAMSRPPWITFFSKLAHYLIFSRVSLIKKCEYACNLPLIWIISIHFLDNWTLLIEISLTHERLFKQEPNFQAFFKIFPGLFCVTSQWVIFQKFGSFFGKFLGA